MSQQRLTEYFGVRSGKRKFAPDGELHASKIQCMERDSKIVEEDVCCQRNGVVAKLNFDEADSSVKTANVPFHKLGNLSPVKKCQPSLASNNLEARRRLSLDNIKRKLTKNCKLADLKSRLKQFNSNYDEAKDTTESTSTSLAKTGLKEFKSIELDVPVSPIKRSSPFTSPVKGSSQAIRSPLKSPGKVPAYQRHASLIASTPTLILPYNYKWLAEMFRAVDTACSLLHNRQETVTFSKIKPAAQEMLKRNVTEKHLSQIKYLSPNMYSFTREKVKNRETSKGDEYDLIIIPNIVDKVTGSPVHTMTPSIVLDRRHSFYNLLLEKTKDYHDDFLRSLEPPMIISRTELKRWHPEFELDNVPDIECDKLPEIPTVEKYLTAQEVLFKTKEMFSNNPRIEKALQKLAESKTKNGISTDDETKPSDQSTQTTSSNITVLNPALRNLPISLLQKLKARQAEKALQTMTRSLMQNENILQYLRLPDLARLVRNLFVTEKKCVLHLDIVLSKLDNSFASKLSNEELLRHLKLLSTEVPEWLTFHNIRKTDFVKLAKDIDMTSVLTKLETLANKHLT